MLSQLKQGPSLPGFRQDEVSMYSALEYRVLLRRRAKVCAARSCTALAHYTVGPPSSIGSCPDCPRARAADMLPTARLLQEDNRNRALPLADLAAGSVKHSRVCYAKSSASLRQRRVNKASKSSLWGAPGLWTDGRTNSSRGPFIYAMLLGE